MLTCHRLKNLIRNSYLAFQSSKIKILLKSRSRRSVMSILILKDAPGFHIFQNVLCLNILFFGSNQGRTRVGRAPRPPSTRVPSGGGSVNITSSSGNLHSTLHCIALTQTKRLRKEINYILIPNNTHRSFV